MEKMFNAPADAKTAAEVADFIARKGRIVVATPNKGGHSRAKMTPLMAAISGEKYAFCENPIRKGATYPGRDHVRQGSQKKMWTRNVRNAMDQTIQHREHLQMLRTGEVGVGAGLIEVPNLKTGTEG
jgi:hypothetical protein